jgi:hypothetical protein
MTILPSTTWHLTGKLTEKASRWRFCKNMERWCLFCATFCLGPVFAISWNVKNHFCNLPLVLIYLNEPIVLIIQFYIQTSFKINDFLIQSLRLLLGTVLYVYENEHGSPRVAARVLWSMYLVNFASFKLYIKSYVTKE